MRHPTLGLQVAPISEQAARQNGVSPGLFVQKVVPGGPAQAAGLPAGDIVTSINKHTMRSPDDLAELETGLDVGDTVKVTYERAGQSSTVQVTSRLPPTERRAALLVFRRPIGHNVSITTHLSLV